MGHGALHKPDAEAGKHGLIRVLDESGEDYGYSAERFFVLDVPLALEKALSKDRNFVLWRLWFPRPAATKALCSNRPAHRRKI